MADTQDKSQLDLLAPLHALLHPGYPVNLREIAEYLFRQLLTEEGLYAGADREHRLAVVAFNQAECLSLELGGGNLYVHKAVSFRLSPRNREMCAKFRGDYKTLAREYKLSEQQCRNIVDAYQREQYLARQTSLLEPDGSRPGPARRGRPHR